MENPHINLRHFILGELCIKNKDITLAIRIIAFALDEPNTNILKNSNIKVHIYSKNEHPNYKINILESSKILKS